MPTGALNFDITAGGVTIGGIISRTGGAEGHATTLAAGLDGTYNSTSNSVTTAGATLDTNSVAAIFWASGKRYGLTVTAANATNVTVNAATGAGNTLPTGGATACVVSAATNVADASFIGSSLKMLAVGADQRAAVQLLDGSNASITVYEILAAKEGYIYADNTGQTAPATNTTASARWWNGSNAAATGKLIAVTTT